MQHFRIDGPCRLNGDIEISGSKNASLPIMAAAILAPGKSVLKRVPDLVDISLCGELLEDLGCKVTRGPSDEMIIDASVIDNPVGAYETVSKLRASICILGPLLARCGKARVSLPGGCAIGFRPIDLHVRGLRALGADIRMEYGDVVAEAPNGLVGTEIFLGGSFGSSVLGTANVLMAATSAKGTTVIESAACEPEIVDLANFLNKMGAKISGIGSPCLTIEGVKELQPVEHEVIPDRIEAGTFMAAAAITRGELRINNCNLSHMLAVVDKLRQIGVTVEPVENGCVVSHSGPIRAVNITTQPHPGFPTDLQAQFMALLCLAEGNSIIVEKVFPNRFMHVAELSRMSANVTKEGAIVIVSGQGKLVSAPVMASDLRASATLVLAGMVAEGTTIVQRIYHIDRGYEKLEVKLNAVGANIVRERAQ